MRPTCLVDHWPSKDILDIRRGGHLFYTPFVGSTVLLDFNRDTAPNAGQLSPRRRLLDSEFLFGRVSAPNCRLFIGVFMKN